MICLCIVEMMIQNFIKENQNVEANPTEILRKMQRSFVKGRALEIQRESELLDEGQTSLLLVDREDLLKSGLSEIACILDKSLTLEVEFYGEVLYYFS